MSLPYPIFDRNPIFDPNTKISLPLSHQIEYELLKCNYVEPKNKNKECDMCVCVYKLKESGRKNNYSLFTPSYFS